MRNTTSEKGGTPLTTSNMLIGAGKCLVLLGGTVVMISAIVGSTQERISAVELGEMLGKEGIPNTVVDNSHKGKRAKVGIPNSAGPIFVRQADNHGWVVTVNKGPTGSIEDDESVFIAEKSGHVVTQVKALLDEQTKNAE